MEFLPYITAIFLYIEYDNMNKLRLSRFNQRTYYRDHSFYFVTYL